MNKLQAGFARVDVTPPLGIEISGYFIPRTAKNILDPLYVNALALTCGEEKVVLMTVDQMAFRRSVIDPIREHISAVTGLPMEAIYIHSTHTHTSGSAAPASKDPLVAEYKVELKKQLATAAQLALNDLKPAKMGFGTGKAPNVSFVRRFRMKDGSVRTNPGVDNPDIVAPIGDVDDRVHVVRFDREGAETIVLANFANHPDVVGGENISADWPGFARTTVEKVLDNTHCILFNGCQGDINHVNVHPTGGYLNDMFMDFDDVARGYEHAKYIGRVVTGGVLQAYDKVQYVDVDTVSCAYEVLSVPANLPDPKDLPEAHRINDLHKAGRDAELPYKGMMLTTKVAEAARMVRLENGPDSFEVPLSFVRIGNIAMVGIAGEPFNGIGRALKETAGWDLIIPTCITNGGEGYYPMRECYDEGGYEAGGSNFRAGVAELIVEKAQAVLSEMK